MKKILIIIAIAVSTFCTAQDFRNVATIEVNTYEFAEKFEYNANHFVTAKKKIIDKSFTFNLIDILSHYTKEISEEDYKHLFVVAVDADGKKSAFSYLECTPEVSQIVPQLFYTKAARSISGVRDTLRIYDVEGTQETNKNQLRSEFATMFVGKIYLQMKNISDEEKKLYFSDASLIFPQDATTKRWLSNVKFLKIYLIK